MAFRTARLVPGRDWWVPPIKFLTVFSLLLALRAISGIEISNSLISSLSRRHAISGCKVRRNCGKVKDKALKCRNLPDLTVIYLPPSAPKLIANVNRCTRIAYKCFSVVTLFAPEVSCLVHFFGGRTCRSAESQGGKRGNPAWTGPGS